MQREPALSKFGVVRRESTFAPGIMLRRTLEDGWLFSRIGNQGPLLDHKVIPPAVQHFYNLKFKEHSASTKL